MNKKEALEVMERIEKYFFGMHYPIKHAMYDREYTVKEMFDKALELLKKDHISKIESYLVEKDTEINIEGIGNLKQIVSHYKALHILIRKLQELQEINCLYQWDRIRDIKIKNLILTFSKKANK